MRFNVFIQSLIRNISGSVGIVLRRWYYSSQFKKCGKNLYIAEGVYIDCPNNVSVGNNVWIDKGVIIITGVLSKKHLKINETVPYRGQLILGDNAHIGIRTILQAHGGIKIGDCFTSGSDAKLYTLSNDVSQSHYGTFNASQNDLYYIQNAIEIGNNVWCGMNTIVLNGPISHNVFIKPNSVSYLSIEENSIVEGSPAVKIKPRFNEA